MKKTILGLALLACMSLATAVSAATPEGLYRDANGDLHFKMPKAGQSIIMEADCKDGFWFVPVAQAGSMEGFESRPVHEVLGCSEEEYNEALQGEGRELSWHKNTDVIIPVHEVLDMTEDEYAAYTAGEGGKEPSRVVKPGSGYNPATWKAPVGHGGAAAN